MNRRWLNVVAVFIVAVLLLLSGGILMATTLFPDLDVVTVTAYLAAGIVILAILAVGVLKWLQRRNPPRPPRPPQ